MCVRPALYWARLALAVWCIMTVAEFDLISRPAKSWQRRIVDFGWATILVGAIAMTATYPGRTHGLGMVTEPLLKDLHQSLASPHDPEGRVFYSSLNFWGTLIGALFCLPVGWLFDRYDRRWILACNLVLLGWAVLWMSTVTTWESLFIGLILTRGLGQSALSVVSITIVAKSFRVHQLGIAMAWYAILFTPMHVLLIQGVGWGLEKTDVMKKLFGIFEVYGFGLTWREVWGGIGVTLLLLSATAFIITRVPAINGSHFSEASKPESGSTLRQALATPAFWVFSLTVSFWGMIYSGVALFNQHIFEERGFDRSLYFDVMSMSAMIALASKLFFGWLVNYVRLTASTGGVSTAHRLLAVRHDGRHRDLARLCLWRLFGNCLGGGGAALFSPPGGDCTAGATWGEFRAWPRC